MKKIGTLNAQLSSITAKMGHTDRLVVCDCGLPIPRQAEKVDLALTKNIPSFIETLRVVLDELCVEEATIASEMETCNAAAYRQLMSMLDGIPVKKVPHEEFKRLSQAEGTVAFVRTGEATPYANVMLRSGVTF